MTALALPIVLDRLIGGLSAPAREHHRHVPGQALGEPGLGAAEVELPDANEILWIAEGTHLLQLGEEIIAPAAAASSAGASLRFMAASVTFAPVATATRADLPPPATSFQLEDANN